MPQHILSTIKGGVTALLDVLYPPVCLGCGTRIIAGDVLCAQCLAGLPALPVTAERSLEHIQSLTFPSEARMMLVGFEHESGGVLEACIHAMKYQSMQSVARWLGRLLGEQLHGSAMLEGDPLLLPVPLHRIKQIERGYNQSALLCEGLSEETGLDVREDILLRRRYTLSQAAARLHREERRNNMLEAFMVNDSALAALRDRPMIIVDDLVTTGATMGECAAALYEHGVRDIRFLALARPRG